MNKLRPSYLNGLKLKPPPELSATSAAEAATSTRSFNAVINRLSSLGSHHEVLVTFSSMLRAKTPQDAHTFPSLLKACTFLGLFRLGVSVHQCILVNGLSSDPYIGSSLLNFYSSLGLVRNARKVFDSMPDRNVVPWTAMIGCYSRARELDDALLLFGEMRRRGPEPSPVTLLGLLPGVSELFHVQCLHGFAILHGFESDVTLMNCILNVYGKLGDISDSKKLFETVAQRDIISWNSMISCCVQSNNVTEALELFQSMTLQNVVPDKQTLGTLLSAVSIMSDHKLGTVVHGKLLRAGFQSDCHIETSLVVMYTKCGKVDVGFKIFQRAKNKDTVLWTAMISVLVQNDFSDKALTVFNQMLKSRTKPSSLTIASTLAACAKLGCIEMGKSIHCYVLRRRMILNTAAKNSLITMYSKCGHLNQSRAVFERMGEKDLVSWNAMVSGYAQNGYLFEGFWVLAEMKRNLEKPDSLTVISLLQACASLGALRQGKLIHSLVIRGCLRPFIKIDTALVDMYSKCGDLSNARKCFDEMPEHDLVSWGTIISCYGSHGRGGSALSLYSEFLKTRIRPDHVIFLSILTACSHNGLVEQGLRLYKSMTESFSIEPNLEHRACVVDLLSRAGRVKEAYEFYKKMFPDGELDVLGIILDACRETGDVELGEVIARRILEMRPSEAGNYVQLAHSFASMRKWDGVGEAWAQMRSLGLKKLPGWSFVELEGNIETFFTRHNSHPQLQEIVSMLKTIRIEMRKIEPRSQNAIDVL